jgi:hypothetical protein
MIERCKDFRLALETCHALAVAGERFGQDFQCDIAPEFRIPGTVHFAHPARTDGGENFIGAESRPYRDRHVVWARILHQKCYIFISVAAG